MQPELKREVLSELPHPCCFLLVASDAATHACSSSSRQQQHCGTVASVGLLGLMGPKAWATGEAYSIAFATIGGMSAGMLASAEHFIEIR
eukprot:1141385-Pelagomonas_calceolata.AAC.3